MNRSGSAHCGGAPCADAKIRALASLSRSFVATGVISVGTLAALTSLVTLTAARGGADAMRAPEATVVVELLGRNGRWQATYPGEDGVFDTADDVRSGPVLHLPAHTAVRLDLRSADAIYFFRVPALRLNEAAVPDLAFGVTFRTGAPGRFTIEQDQICGRMHPDLRGELVVETRGRFRAWMSAIARSSPAPADRAGND